MDRSLVAGTLRGKTILVTGGTGSFGHQIVKSLLEYAPASIRVYSRDEKKQHDMKQAYAEHANLRFLLGDVRDYGRTCEVTRGADIVFHAAAMKQVPSSEEGPWEAVKTNVVGAENVRRAAIENRVATVVAISTDKAVKPVNVMGMTKSLQERLILGPPADGAGTTFVCVRYGNVLGSRGSVIPLFKQQVQAGKPMTITHPQMTRFLLTLCEAVELVMWATVKGQNGDLWVRKMPAANVVDLAKTVALGVCGDEDYPTKIIGTRAGEKLHEVLVSEEEMWRATQLDQHYLIPAWWRSAQQQEDVGADLPEYASDSFPLLARPQLFDLLRGDGWFDDARRLKAYNAAA
ncbi:MAG: SDR family NAD(P)-dependent oxidoreductase [Planctomycetota bacterium]